MKKSVWNKLPEILVGAVVCFFLGTECIIIIQYLIHLGIQLNTNFLYPFIWLTIALLFCAIVRRIIRSSRNGLVKYFFFAVTASVAVVMILIICTMSIIRIPMINERILQYVQTVTGGLVMTLLLNFYLLFLVGAFACSFVLIVRGKVKYIRYISQRVGEMENNGFGTLLDVRYNDELSELSTRINKMSLALMEKQANEKKAEENKNKLIADISHDLRTPLTSIIGYVNLLEQNGFEDKTKFNQYIEVVGRRLENLKSMIDQLFEFTKLNQSDAPINMKETNLSTLLSYIDFEYGNIFRKHGYSWELSVMDADLLVALDVDKFMRAIGNLLENAKKYSIPNTEIKMKVFKSCRNVIIQLSNETNIKNQEDIDKIFERFFRLDQSRSNENGNDSGTGLGLPIAKRIIELHGGVIVVKLYNHRITFEISLPYVEEK